MDSQPMIYLSEELIDEVIKWAGNPYGAPEYQIDPNMQREILEHEQNRNYDEIKLSVDKVENVDKVLQALKEQNIASYSITQNLEEMKLVFLILQVVLGLLGEHSLSCSFYRYCQHHDYVYYGTNQRNRDYEGGRS